MSTRGAVPGFSRPDTTNCAPPSGRRPKVYRDSASRRTNAFFDTGTRAKPSPSGTFTSSPEPAGTFLHPDREAREVGGVRPEPRRRHLGVDVAFALDGLAVAAVAGGGPGRQRGRQGLLVGAFLHPEGPEHELLHEGRKPLA